MNEASKKPVSELANHGKALDCRQGKGHYVWVVRAMGAEVVTE